MHARPLFTTALLVCTFAATAFAQVNVAGPGESGLGIGAAAAFASDGSAIGAQFVGTASGLVDLGISIRHESPDAGTGYWVKGLSLNIVPLRTRDRSVRWSLGGMFNYEFTNIKYETSYYDPYHGGFPSSSSKSVDVLSFGGILFADVDVSRKTYLQFAAQIALADYNASSQSITLYTFGAGFVTRQSIGGKVGFLASATIPSEGDYWTFGVQMNLFFAQHKKRKI